MKLPNNYGSITKLKGNRRKPYLVRVPTHWITTEEGKEKQERKIVGYARTREEAIQILADFHGNPYDSDQRKISFKEVYDAWFKEYESSGARSNSSIISYKASFKAVQILHERPFRELKTAELQNAIIQSEKNYPTMKKIKLLLSQMYKYAIKNDICMTNYSDFIDISVYHDKNPNSIKREPFSTEEIVLLWKNSKNRIAKIVFMYIYTGVRATELLNLKNCDIDMDNKVFHIRKSKTENGVRVVPIAEKIEPFFHYFMSENNENLITCEGKKLSYWNYLNTYFTPLMESLGMKHHIHDTRHTCISLLTLADVKPVTIKKILGHKGAMSLTEKVYTHLDYAELLEAINRI